MADSEFVIVAVVIGVIAGGSEARTGVVAGVVGVGVMAIGVVIATNGGAIGGFQGGFAGGF